MIRFSNLSSAKLATAAAIATALVASVVTLSAAATRPTPPQGGGAMGQTIAGISCDEQEGQRIHIHQHLLILDHGKPVDVPANIGIPLGKRCLYWVHTHTPDGIIHIEAPQDRTFKLGDFFAVWGQPLSKTQVAGSKTAKGTSMKVWLDGKPYAGNPADIALKPHADIVIEVGPPFPTPPRFTKWGTL